LIRLLNTPEAMFHAAAEQVCRVGEMSLTTTGRFSLVLSGGSTPRRLYELLAQAPYRTQLEWSRVEFFWGDERAVPPDHPDSNFRMAREAMLDPLGIDTAHVHRIMAEKTDLDEVARDYEQEIERVLGRVAGVGRRPPHFNLFLLGMGDDGHTASLFPGTRALSETERWVVAHDVKKLSTRRVTMTPPLINAAHFILFLASGASKADMLAQVIQGKRDPERLPAQLIHPLMGEVMWFIDRDASTGLIRQVSNEA
jgi:6-phosphogluconolactonase